MIFFLSAYSLAIFQFFSKDANANKYTLQPHDRRLTAAMGQRAHLSFTDIKTINDLYDCNSK